MTELIKISGKRHWQRLMEMAKIGATPKGGVCRVALTDEDKQGRDLFIKWCKAAGCKVEIDQLGNIFARRAGKNNALPPVMIGSHLDSQPTGGKFDGVYGVLAGLEVIETLNDHQIETVFPIEVVSWTNEEGARFAPAMLASGVFAGVFTLDYAYARTDKSGKTLGEALERIDFKGSLPVGNRPYTATFEVHIEQGPILEMENKSIGIVTGVQGIRWYDLVLTGKETHAGPSPMSWRIDPVKAAIPILAGLYNIADMYEDSRVTVGFLDASPGVKNTVPGVLTISIDLRHPDDHILSTMDSDLKRIV
ncbi:MAG: hydantoinase/carbamoylase family amidase, partial [Bacteroidota bacterium]